MTTLTLKALSVCSGGNHAEVQISVNGTPRATVKVTADEIAAAPANDELQAAVDVLLRAYSIGRTKSQVKTALMAGIDITL